MNRPRSRERLGQRIVLKCGSHCVAGRMRHSAAGGRATVAAQAAPFLGATFRSPTVRLARPSAPLSSRGPAGAGATRAARRGAQWPPRSKGPSQGAGWPTAVAEPPPPPPVRCRRLTDRRSRHGVYSASCWHVQSAQRSPACLPPRTKERQPVSCAGGGPTAAPCWCSCSVLQCCCSC